jgi:hypothetical protein
MNGHEYQMKSVTHGQLKAMKLMYLVYYSINSDIVERHECAHLYF